MTFNDFFPKENIYEIEHERIISSRFPAFRARAIDERRAGIIRQGATKTKNLKGSTIREVDGEANMLGLILECVTYPDLHDSTLQEAWGTIGAQSLIQAMLLPGEYAALCAWISEICGFDKSINELIENAKN